MESSAVSWKLDLDNIFKLHEGKTVTLIVLDDWVKVSMISITASMDICHHLSTSGCMQMDVYHLLQKFDMIVFSIEKWGVPAVSWKLENLPKLHKGKTLASFVLDDQPQHLLDGVQYMISVGLGGAISILVFLIHSTRVSNELGAGRPERARLALQVMIAIALTEGAIIGITTILVRNFWGKFYSNEDEVIEYVANMMLLLSLSDFLDGFQCVLSGSARGCGWQNLCTFINLGAYYVVAIPCAILFAFVFHIGGMGLWMGIICGLIVQVVALVAVNACTDWDQETRGEESCGKSSRDNEQQL